MQQRSELRRLFKESWNSAGSRALMSMMRELGYQIGRFKVRNLMKEAGLTPPDAASKGFSVMGKAFDPSQPEAYIKSFAIKRDARPSA